MFRLKDKNTKRIVAAICLLLTFTFMSLYATYQNGQDFNAAYASSSSNNAGAWECAKAIVKCAAAEAAALVICELHGWGSLRCIASQLAAVAVCMDVKDKCF